jgi:hypothetical protein
LKPEWWGSPLVQEEKYQEKPVEREYEIIIIIIIIIATIISIVIDAVDALVERFENHRKKLFVKLLPSGTKFLQMLSEARGNNHGLQCLWRRDV